MKNNFKKLQFFLSIIFFIFSLLIFLFLYRQINNNNQKAEQSVVEFTSKANQLDQIKVLNRSIGTIKEEKSLLETHFAQSSDIVPFLGTIEALALKAGVKAEVASVDASKDIGVLGVQVNTSGNFQGLYKFLTLLENSPYELEFTSIDMQKESGSGVLTASTVPAKSAQASNWQTTFKIRLLSFVQ